MSDGTQRPDTPWLHEMFDNLSYRALIKNRLFRNDEHGIEITYDWRRPDHQICGARTIKPGIPGATAPWWFPVDPSQDHESVCLIVGDHSEVPHIGVPAGCADQTCDCFRNGSRHLVIVGFARTPPTVETADDLNESILDRVSDLEKTITRLEQER